MASTVASIVTQGKSIAAVTLGDTWQELQFVYDVTKLNDRTSTKAYGIRPLAASTAPGVNKSYSLHHQFELLLTDNVTRATSDAEVEAVITNLYDQSDEIFKAIVNTKLNLSTVVVNVFDPELSEPEFIDKIVVLRMRFTVLYRSALP